SLPLGLHPTELFARQVYVSVDMEEVNGLAATVACLGAGNVCWSTDFPHPDHEWQGMAAGFIERMDLPDDDVAQVMGANAARAYKLGASGAQAWWAGRRGAPGARRAMIVFMISDEPP